MILDNYNIVVYLMLHAYARLIFRKTQRLSTMYKRIVSKSYSKKLVLNYVTEVNEIEAMDDTQFCKAFVKK